MLLVFVVLLLHQYYDESHNRLSYVTVFDFVSSRAGAAGALRDDDGGGGEGAGAAGEARRARRIVSPPAPHDSAPGAVEPCGPGETAEGYRPDERILGFRGARTWGFGGISRKAAAQ